MENEIKELQQKIRRNLKDLKAWAGMELNNAQKTLDSEADLVARDLEEKARDIRDGKIWSTDCQNMVGRLNTLWDLKKEVEMLQSKVNQLNELED